MKNLLHIAAAFMFFGVLLFQSVVAQNYAAPYLQFSTSVEAAGFGNAFTALTDDATSTYWNPAGLALIKSYSFTSLSAINLGLDRQFQSAAFAFRLPLGVLGASFASSGVKDIMGYDDNNSKTGSFNVMNTVPALSYALAPNENVSIGTTFKYIRQDLNVQIDNGYSVDFGLRYRAEMLGTDVTTSVMFQNFSGKVGVNDLPRVLRLGAGINLKGIVAAADFVFEDMNDIKSRKILNIGFGYQATVQENFIFEARTGFQQTQYPSAGIGIGAKLGVLIAKIDYAFVTEPYSIFSQSHRVGLSITGL